MSKSIQSASALQPMPAYTLIKEEYLPDYKSLGLIFRHNKSGARVCVLSNTDKNKSFCAAFRTTPTNSTGVPHIIEHCVLNGSKNFPCREPFMQLMKGHLTTFLNAMTYPDKTIYPVSSCNDRDFLTLMHVYLDAVFYPNIYRYKEIFQQEGWHYDLPDADAQLTINGVVYSEMKGAMSSPERIADEVLTQYLYPDTTYGVNSGGDPDVIPSLTYEEFLDFHRRYYHPSNSYLFLYGDFDIEERLGFLDEAYLSHFDAIDPKTEIVPQTHFGEKKPRCVSEAYPIGIDESPDGKFTFAYGAACGTNLNQLDRMAWSVLSEILINMPGAPLKQALMAAGIGSRISGWFNSEIIEGTFSVTALNAKEEDYEKFYSVIRETLTGLVQNGLNQKALLATINHAEFRFREDADTTPKGLIAAINMMQTWLYGDTADFRPLHVLTLYAQLKEKIGTTYYEDLIRRYLLESDHAVLMKLVPTPGLNERKAAALAEKLAAYKASLSAEEITALVSDTKALADYQNHTPTEEEMNCIPSLHRTDIDRKMDSWESEHLTIAGIPAMRHVIDSNGIVYGRLVFKMPEMPAKWIHYAGMLDLVLGKMDTANSTYSDLAIDIRLNTGSLTFTSTVFQQYQTENHIPVYVISYRAMPDKLSFVMDTIRDVLTTTAFDDIKRLREVLAEYAAGYLQRVQTSGNAVAAARARSYFRAADLYREYLCGMEQYLFIKSLLSDFDNRAEEISSALRTVCAAIFDPANLIYSIAADAEGMQAAEQTLPTLTDALSKIEHPALGISDMPQPAAKNEGFAIASQVNYDVRCGMADRTRFPYSGAYAVLAAAIDNDHLYPNIRVRGGAYGYRCIIQENGLVTYASYRDPHIKQTDCVYQDTAAFVRDTPLTEAVLEQYVIGAFSDIDYPKSPADRIYQAFLSDFTGKPVSAYQKEREEALDITMEEFHACAAMLADAANGSAICVVGSAAKIQEDAALFDAVITID